MKFLSPEWLILLPAILLLGIVVKRLQIFRPLRLIAIAIVSILLAKPSYNSFDQSLDLWVLFDRSDSTGELVAIGEPEWKKILQKSKPSREDTLNYIDYAADVVSQSSTSESATYIGNTKLTRTQLALEDVNARLKEGRPSRIVVFTDGYSTEPLQEIGSTLAAKNVPVDFRIVREEDFADFRVSSVDLPTQVQVGEPFLLSIVVKGHLDMSVPLKIFQNEKELKVTDVKLENGTAKVEFTTRQEKAGSYAYKVKIFPESDAHEGNNSMEKWVQVTGGPRVLLVSNYDNDPLASVLKRQNYEVDFVSDSSTLQIGQLAGAKSVIFNNVPLHEIPNSFLEALPFYVNEQGGGLMMVGGERSFAGGGFYKSAIDKLLPVTMELKNDHRKLSVALAIVMDRSGSMSLGVPAPGGGIISKMQLANNGAAEAIELLGFEDQVAVYAVDTQSTTIVSLQTIRDKKNSLKRKAMKVVSQGGGIFVYTGLKTAWDDLKKSALGTKHIILFTDASDTEEPGKYKELLAEMAKADATVSVIGLGKKGDRHAALIEDIAKRGNGRIFFTEKAQDIPRLFAQETVTLARSAFIEESTNVIPTGGWDQISSKPISWLNSVDGYNLTYLREDATASLITQDEYSAPLVAHWRRGMGRVAALTMPTGGEFSKSTREWQTYGDFNQTLIKWLNGESFPAGITMRHRLEGTRLTIDLLYDTSNEGVNWSKVFALHPPKIRLQEESGEVHSLTWKRVAPGHYSLHQDLNEGSLVKGAIQAGSYALPFGPLKVGSNTEWKFESERLEELKALSQQTGGSELIDISKAWVRPEVSFPKSLMLPLCILLLICIIAEAAVTRLALSLNPLPFLTAKLSRTAKSANNAGLDEVQNKINIPSFSKSTRKAKISRKSNQKNLAEQPTHISKSVASSEAPKKESAISRSERFAKAKRKK